MYRSAFSRDVFAELDRLQRGLQQAFELSPSIRGRGRGFPAINLSSTPTSLEIHVFAPGLDPASLEVQLDKGVLTLAGNRPAALAPDKATVHIGERFEGPFRRVLNLPDDIDAAGISAHYRDGVLHVHVPRRAAAQSRRITVQ
ncbi:MAG: Hsp20/alpha crystallin family protein [Pseudomonadota bacterium]|nr:Hsp20/alpha crystallin family protein [Pseudomonadota bacterium]